MLNQIFSIILLIFGEALCVYSEMVAAKQAHLGLESSSSIFTKNFALITCAGAMLIAGYMMGYTAFKNIWLVSVISVTSILIVEPLLTYVVFQEIPGRGPIVGLFLGALGFVATLVL